jgi:hypothetical protein
MEIVGACFCGKNTTSIIQPLDHGRVLATKRLCRKWFLEEVMFVLEDKTEESEHTRGQRTLQNLRNYTIKSEIFNFAATWKAVKRQTLESGWKHLLNNIDANLQFTACEVSDSHRTIWNVGEKKVTEDAILQWLEEDESDPGYQVMTEREIAEEVLAHDKTNEERDDEEEEEEWPPICKIKKCELRSHLEDLITFIDSSCDLEVQSYYSHSRAFREIIIRKHQTSKTQRTSDAFFKPISQPKPLSPRRSTSSANGVNLFPGLTINMEEEESESSSE